jgi:hypothetical protein
MNLETQCVTSDFKLKLYNSVTQEIKLGKAIHVQKNS